jgi:hypothetical protein
MLVILLLMTGALSDLSAQYGGPSILSRGGNRPGQRGRAPIDFNFYAAARGLLESGLLYPRLDDEGVLQPQNSYGVSSEVGVYGGHNWKSTTMGLDYRADYRHSANLPNALNGTNQALALQLEHRLSRRVTLSFSQTAGTSNRAFGAFAVPTFSDANRLGVPMNEVFDVRLYYLQSNLTGIWQRSARTSYIGGADVFFVKRDSLALINAQGMRASGAVSYRTSRRNTVVASYQYLRFEYPRIYAHSYFHTINGGLQSQWSRNIQVRLIAGVFVGENRGVEQVRLSDEVAAILGRPVGTAAFVRSSRFPMIDAGIAHIQERGRFQVSFTTAASPGNGMMLASMRTTASAGYSYTGIRRTSLGVSAGYMRLTSEALSLPDNNAFGAGGGFSYRVRAGLQLTGQLDYRNFQATSAFPARSGYSAMLGLAYSTSRFPISIW